MTVASPPNPEASSSDSEAQPPAAPRQAPRVGSALRVIASLTTLSRFSGLARDAVCSRIFGAGAIWSAFAFAFLLPNLFRRLFGEGALSAAFLPEYARLTDADPPRAGAFAGAMVRIVSLWLIGATIAGEVILGVLVLAGVGAEDGLALRLAMIMLPFMPLVCTTAIFGSMLQCHDRFGVPAAAPILVNLCIIAAATTWTFWLEAGTTAAIYAVAIAVLIAGVFQVGWSLAALRRHRPSIHARTESVRPEIRRTLRRMAPVAIGMSALQINTLIDGLIASWPVLVGPTISIPFLTSAITYPLDEASNSILFFGQRLYHFPLGVFGIALATAVFPMLSRSINEPKAFRDTLLRGLRLSLFIGVPASVGLALIREPLIAVIYRGGEFSDEAMLRTASVLLGYSPGIWAFALIHVFTRAMYAHGDTRTPVRVSLVTIGVNFILNVSLIWVLREAALAWSTTACAIGQCAVLAVICRRRFGDGSRTAALVTPVGRTLVATGAMAIAVLAAGWALPADGDWWIQFLRLSVCVSAGGAAFVIVAIATRAPEIGWLLERNRPDANAGPA